MKHFLSIAADIETGKSSSAAEERSEMATKLAEAFRQSDVRRQMEEELEVICSKPVERRHEDTGPSAISYPVSFWSQVGSGGGGASGGLMG